MATRQVVFCDGCGAEQRTENHWWTIFREDGELILRPSATGLEISAGDIFHLCGAACAVRKVSEFLSEAGKT